MSSKYDNRHHGALYYHADGSWHGPFEVDAPGDHHVALEVTDDQRCFLVISKINKDGSVSKNPISKTRVAARSVKTSGGTLVGKTGTKQFGSLVLWLQEPLDRASFYQVQPDRLVDPIPTALPLR